MDRSDPDQQLIDAIVQLSHLAQRALSDAARGVEVPVQQMQALCRLLPGPKPMSALAADLGHTRSSTTELVDRLHARGLVNRTTDRTDRRRQLISLTAEGRELAERSYTGVDDELLPVLAPLSAAQRTQMRNTLTRILTPQDFDPRETTR